MTQLNPATGLPALPEGQWWEVEEAPRLSYAHGWSLSPHLPYRVAIRELGTVKRRESYRTWFFGFETSRTVEEPGVVTVATAYVEDAHSLAGLTTRRIRKAAFQLQESRNREAKAKTLLGSYPPQALPGKEA